MKELPDVKFDPDVCVPWTGTMLKDKYPIYGSSKNRRLVRREIYIRHWSVSLNKDDQVVSTCSTLGCWNPYHLTIQSHRQLARKTLEENRSQMNASNGRRRLDDRDAVIAVVLTETFQLPRKRVAKYLGVSVRSISWLRRVWLNSQVFFNEKSD